MSAQSSRVARIAVWIGNAVAVAAIGALAGGVAEAISADGLVEVAGTIGYSALAAWPALVAVVIAARLLWRGWRTDQLAAAVVDEHGSAPRLAAWLAYLLIACGVLAWATFATVYMLSAISGFKPQVIAIALPPAEVAIALVLVAASRPVVGGLAAGAAALDRRFRARFRRSLFRPRIVLAAGAALVVVLAIAGWTLSVAPRIGYLDLGILVHPVVALVGAVAGHLALARLPRRPRVIAAASAAVGVAAAIGLALWLRGARPLAVLQIWARPTIASEVVERLYYLEDIRHDISFTVARPEPRPGAAPRDVVLITIDTVRADRTPMGGGPAVMPNVVALGDRGAVFTAAFAPGNVTRRSIPTLVTGVSPTRIKGKVAGWALRLDPRHILLAERFRAAGYDTAGFMCCESFWAPRVRLGLNRGLDHLAFAFDGGKLADAAHAWVTARAARTSRPLFVWVHFYEPHIWLKGRTDLKTATERRAQYDRVLGEVDDYVGTVIDAFPRDGARSPIIVVTADHGEGLGDHGQPYHSTDLYDSQIHVPLVIAGPGVPPHQVIEPLGLVGLSPTLLELAGFVPPGMPQMDGTSFAPLVTGSAPGNPDAGYAFAAMIVDRSTPKGMRAVVRGPWKLIETARGLELYNRITDPRESQNVAGSQPEKLAQLRRLLDERARVDTRSPFGSP